MTKKFKDFKRPYWGVDIYPSGPGGDGPSVHGENRNPICNMHYFDDKGEIVDFDNAIEMAEIVSLVPRMVKVIDELIMWRDGKDGRLHLDDVLDDARNLIDGYNSKDIFY